MQHRVRLPAITKAKDFLEYSLVGHEAVAARNRKEASPLPCYVSHRLFSLASSLLASGVLLYAISDCHSLLLWLASADFAPEVFSESFVGCGVLEWHMVISLNTSFSQTEWLLL